MCAIGRTWTGGTATQREGSRINNREDPYGAGARWGKGANTSPESHTEKRGWGPPPPLSKDTAEGAAPTSPVRERLARRRTCQEARVGGVESR